MHRQSVAVAMTVGVDLRLRARLADERIVRRHRAVVAQTQRLADVVVERLRLHAQAVVIRSVRTELLRVAADAIAIADRDVEGLVLAEEHAAGEVAAGFPRVGDEDLLHVAEHVALEEPARDRQRRALLAGLRIRDVDEPVLREVGMDGDEVQRVVALSGGAACCPAAEPRCRRRPHRLRRQHAVADDAQRAASLGHQDRVRIGEGEAPRVEQSRGHRHHANLAALHVEDLRARVARRGRRRLLPAPCAG